MFENIYRHLIKKVYCSGFLFAIIFGLYSNILLSQELYIGVNTGISNEYYISFNDLTDDLRVGKSNVDVGVNALFKFNRLMINSNISFFIDGIGFSSISVGPGIKFGWYEIGGGLTIKATRTELFSDSSFRIEASDNVTNVGYNISHSFHFNQAYRINLTTDFFPNIETFYSDENLFRVGIGLSVNLSAFQ